VPTENSRSSRVIESQYYTKLVNYRESGANGTNLVDHHDSQKITDCSKEKSVKVVLDGLANSVTEDIENNLSNDEEECTESEISQWPAILQSIDHKNNLGDKVNYQSNGRDQVQNNEKSNGVGRAKTSP
jgi:hypothetical protein